jgi:hypothetical protein
MQEVITKSGAVIRHDAKTPDELAAIEVAVEALGGQVVVAEYDGPRETALRIMDQSVVGTTMTDRDGVVWTLHPNGWLGTDVDGHLIPAIPPYDKIVSATMPGGWAWTL